MELGIAGRTAVVTGGTKGIGAATVRLLEEAGVKVVVAARSVGIDVTDADAAERIAAAVRAPVDILVNNAGTSFATSLDELTDADWHDQYELHVVAPMRLMRAFAPGMAERGWGRIVTVASSAGKRPSLTNPAYSVSKAAALSLSRLFADVYTPRGVLVNSVAPGAVATDLWMGENSLPAQIAAIRGGTEDEARAAQAAKSPLGRLAHADEVAAVIVFLCSERASAVSGAAWSVDGGLVPGII